MSFNDYPDKEPVIGRDHPDFVPQYAYENPETGDTFTAPFPAVVFGIDQEFFGMGKVIGLIRDNPVIEVEDRDDGLPYYVMGYESWWACPTPEEILDRIASGELTIDSVAAYRTRQDDHWAAVEESDKEFLEDTDIDPGSL
jgi:hypothetical protein